MDQHVDGKSTVHRPILISTLTYQLGSSFDGNDFRTLAVVDSPRVGELRRIRRLFSPASTASLPVNPSYYSDSCESQLLLNDSLSYLSETSGETEAPPSECEQTVVHISLPCYIENSIDDNSVLYPSEYDNYGSYQPDVGKRRHRSVSV